MQDSSIQDIFSNHIWRNSENYDEKNNRLYYLKDNY